MVSRILETGATYGIGVDTCTQGGIDMKLLDNIMDMVTIDMQAKIAVTVGDLEWVDDFRTMEGLQIASILQFAWDLVPHYAPGFERPGSFVRLPREEGI